MAANSNAPVRDDQGHNVGLGGVSVNTNVFHQGARLQFSLNFAQRNIPEKKQTSTLVGGIMKVVS